MAALMQRTALSGRVATRSAAARSSTVVRAVSRPTWCAYDWHSAHAAQYLLHDADHGIIVLGTPEQPLQLTWTALCSVIMVC